MLTSLSACMLAERATRNQLSQWIINGCNVMTDDSERPVPPHPWPSGVVLVSTVRKRQRPTQFDWLILSSTLLPSLHSVQSELSLNLSQSRSAWLQSHRASHRHSWKRICPPSTIFFNSLYITLQSSRPTYHVLSVVLKLSKRHIVNPGLFNDSEGSVYFGKIYLLSQMTFNVKKISIFFFFIKL